MSSGERPIGAAKGKQSDTEALCQPPPPLSTPPCPSPPRGGGGGVTWPMNNTKSTGNQKAPKPPRNNFSWVYHNSGHCCVLSVLPGGGWGASLGDTSPLGGGGEPLSLREMDMRGGESRMIWKVMAITKALFPLPAMRPRHLLLTRSLYANTAAGSGAGAPRPRCGGVAFPPSAPPCPASHCP